MTTSIDLGDGRTVRCDQPPPEIEAAAERLRAAGGRDPRDALLLMRWLDEQEAKYPTKRGAE